MSEAAPSQTTQRGEAQDLIADILLFSDSEDEL
jgi:hypothetical protein